ncbi:GtrA family protein [Calidifontibacter sp. DB0510]|uniref:GtrA family protein n=2 Tax=Metallococcus carri TaxID=1656884 RepID=A0A967E7J8_9MICO|nr:GtrA family protein [Metallococcus carri]NOP36948.1 GtrA family protein [Calidifontibacter sp. DB2511S]
MTMVWRELAKFGIVGAIAFVVDMGGFNLLVSGPLAHKVTTAKIASGLAGTVVAWLGNRYWTFRHRRGRPVQHEVALFFLVNGIALAISAGWVAFAHYALHATGTAMLNLHALIGIGLGTIFRFWTYQKFVFAHEPVAGPPAEPVAPAGAAPATHVESR